MSARLVAFRALATHAWYGKFYARLSAADLRDCESFIIERESEDKGTFEMAVNRWNLDRPELRGKNHTLKMELLAVANTSKEAT